MYYISDLAKMKRYYEQTKFSAEMMANMLQNVSQSRDNKAINKTDIQNAFTAAFFNIYPDNNFSPIVRGHKHDHWCEIFVYYVKGNDNGTASVVWAYIISQFNFYNSINMPSQTAWQEREDSNDRSHINIKINSTPSSICPELTIKPGEIKIILEACIDYDAELYKLHNGNSTSTVDYSKVLGFYVIKPRYTSRTKGERACFNSVVIFTPKPGLFSETASQ